MSRPRDGKGKHSLHTQNTRGSKGILVGDNECVARLAMTRLLLLVARAAGVAAAVAVVAASVTSAPSALLLLLTLSAAVLAARFCSKKG